MLVHYRGLSITEICRDPGSNRGPSDLQSDALPTELSRLCFKFEAQSITEENNGKRVSFIGKQWRCHHGAAVSLLAHVSAITFGTRDICLPFFIRRVFPDPSSPLNPNSVREHVQIPDFGSRLFFFFVNLEIGLRCRWPRGPMDKASAYGAGDCRFESCRGHFCFWSSSAPAPVGARTKAPMRGSSPRPYAYEAHALPTELRRHEGIARPHGV